jgi:type I restriction enzyme R subunit
VFGDYVSVYNFAQSIADGATVPLYYEARKPELQLATDELRDELDELLDEAALDEEQEKKLQREFARQYQLITREDRLDQIAKDVVQHFAARGYRGKAMFVAIDKATAVRMYDKVRKEWAAELTAREQQLAGAPEEARATLAERLDWMRSVDWRWWSANHRTRSTTSSRRGWTSCPTGSGCKRKTLIASSKMLTIR